MPSIWLCHQTGSAPDTPPAWLTESETDALSRLTGPRRREYLTSRWLIRQALAGASGESPRDCRPISGRPTASETPPGWHLTLSHSHGLSACAVGPLAGIGIDIEPRRRHPRWEKVVQRWFSPVEQAWLLTTGTPADFLAAWTLKEAWLKATGRGIANNLQTLEIRPGFELYGDQPDTDWRVCSYDCEGFLVTLVYRKPETEGPQALPGIQLLSPPPDNFDLDEPERLPAVWEPVIQRNIHPKE
ncbi:MAG: 4'-phosphopantetheinyl transferase superfamily protein [Marinobacter sp.]|nr:4'-phosphopantetheinyl transferase superfamily protein [Marinobacter sp.]